MSCGTLRDVDRQPTLRARDIVAIVGVAISVPFALVGLLLPSHDYAGLGDPRMAQLVDRDTLLVSFLITAFAACVAALPLALWPRAVIRAVAACVLLLALWNLGRVLSYYWWRSELVFCHGGC